MISVKKKKSLKTKRKPREGQQSILDFTLRKVVFTDGQTVLFSLSNYFIKLVYNFVLHIVLDTRSAMVNVYSAGDGMSDTHIIPFVINAMQKKSIDKNLK